MSISVQSIRDAIEEWYRAPPALPRRAIRPVRDVVRARPVAGVAHHSTAVDGRSIVVSVHDSPREETRSPRVARARTIQTGPRAGSVTESRRDSTPMCRASFQTLRAQTTAVNAEVIARLQSR